MADDTRSTGSRGIEPDAASLALAAADMGAYEWNLATDTLTVSPRAAAITGLPAGAMSARGGAALDECIHPEDLDNVHGAARAGRLSRSRYEVRFRCIRPDD